MNESINHEAVHRTAPATPGLLNIQRIESIRSGMFLLNNKDFIKDNILKFLFVRPIKI